MSIEQVIDRWEAAQASAATLSWAAGAPAVLGGDFNLRRLELDGLRHAGGHDVDHVFATGLTPVGDAQTLDSGRLSDHRPVIVVLEG